MIFGDSVLDTRVCSSFVPEIALEITKWGFCYIIEIGVINVVGKTR